MATQQKERAENDLQMILKETANLISWEYRAMAGKDIRILFNKQYRNSRL